MALFRLDGAVSLRLDLAHDRPAPPWDVRELARAELEAVLSGTAELAQRVGDLDRVAPHGWRCFAAFEGAHPVHVSYVETRPGRPLLFSVVTEPHARGRGAFRATVRHIGGNLRERGECTLFSAASRSNAASLRAHQAAGFVVVSTALDPIVLGVSLRDVARRLLGRSGV